MEQIEKKEIHVACKEKNIVEIFERDLPFCTYAKFSEKLTFLSSWYAQVCVFYYESLQENGEVGGISYTVT